MRTCLGLAFGSSVQEDLLETKYFFRKDGHFMFGSLLATLRCLRCPLSSTQTQCKLNWVHKITNGNQLLDRVQVSFNLNTTVSK